MILKRVIAVTAATMGLGVLAAVSAPAASADVTVPGLSGHDCILIEDPYVTITPTIGAGSGDVHFYGVSECM